MSNECYTEPDSNTRRWSNRTAMAPKRVLLQDSQREAVREMPSQETKIMVAPEVCGDA